jgi:transcriptional regulator NrdR family protein
MPIFVVKRDKSLEEFDPDKIRKVVEAAGLNDEEAGTLVNEVVNWLESLGKDKVTSLQIRDKVVVEIQKINKNVAEKFISYEMNRDKKYND